MRADKAREHGTQRICKHKYDTVTLLASFALFVRAARKPSLLMVASDPPRSLFLCAYSLVSSATTKWWPDQGGGYAFCTGF